MPRKTADSYSIQVHYGQGWEDEIEEPTYKKAKQRKKEYNENCPKYPVRIVKVRVPLNYWK